MEALHIIETTGSITKSERLSNFSGKIVQNTLVLASSNPFPGYNVDILNSNENTKPFSYYLITVHRYFNEKMERITKVLKQENFIECCSGFGEIIWGDTILPCISLRNLKSTDIIASIQAFYKRNDIKLMEYKKVESECIIKVFEHYKLVDMPNDIYRDLYDKEKFYFKIPIQIGLKLLIQITKHIKSFMTNSNFDAAIGIINRFKGPEDVIRIYDKNQKFERALEIRKYYLKEFKRRIKLSSTIHNTMVQ